MKHFISFIITLLISLLISALLISFSLKEVMINSLSAGIVKGEISNKIVSQTKEAYPEADFDTLNKIETSIGNSIEITDITEKYFDSITNFIINDEELVIPNIKEDIISLIEKNENILKENGIVITEEQKNMIIDKLDDKKLESMYEKISVNVKEKLPEESKTLIKIYDKYTKPTFRYALIAIILFLILILALIKKSYYRWTFNLSVSLALSGTLLALFIPLFNSKLTLFLKENIEKNLSININPLVNLGYICLGMCAVCLIIYIVGNKITRYNERKNLYLS